MALIVQDIIIPEPASECSEWMGYFNKLKDKFGEENARIIWLKTWQVNGSASCTTKAEFNTFLKKHHIDVSNMATAAVAGISDLGSDLLGMGKNMTKMITYGVPVVLVAIIAAILYAIVRISDNTSASDLVQLTPEGKAMQLLK